MTARQKGTDWYIGGLGNWAAHDLTLSLGFLGDGSFEAISCTDGPNADRNPVDYQFSTRTVTRTESLPVHLAPGGGFLIRLRKK